MLYPDSPADYLTALHEGLLAEISSGVAYDHACGMMAIEIGKRLLATSLDAPELLVVKAEKGEKLLPLIYGGVDGFTTHMVVQCDDLVYDPLASQSVSLSSYPGCVFTNSNVVLRPCGASFTNAQLQRGEPTGYEWGLPPTEHISGA